MKKEKRLQSFKHLIYISLLVKTGFLTSLLLLLIKPLHGNLKGCQKKVLPLLLHWPILWHQNLQAILLLENLF